MVAFFLEVGALLIVVPWSMYWERNYFGTVWPPLRVWLANDYVRGAVSGLGIVNVAAGIAELLPIVFPPSDRSLPNRPKSEDLP